MNVDFKMLVSKYRNQFKKGYYAVYLVNYDEFYNFKIVESFFKQEFRNVVDNFGYSSGVYIDVLSSNANPLDGTIADESPLGKKLLTSNPGDHIYLQIDTSGEELEYIVLCVGEK